jgi:hypothetical protein
MVGATATYNHSFQAGRATLAQQGDTFTLMIKSMFNSFVWPLYWLAFLAGS